MLIVAPRAAARLNQALQAELPVIEEGEGVGGVMAVRVLEKAGHAKIVVLTVRARDHIGSINFYAILESNHGKGKDLGGAYP